MIEFLIGKEYTVDPNSIRFDQEMTEYNRMYTRAEYEKTKMSIEMIGQTNPIHINSETGLCENGRHRVKIANDLGIKVKCVQVDGKINKIKRLAFYNLDQISGRDLSVSQKAIQAHKYALISKEKLDDCAILFNVKKREISAANTINGLGRSDIFDSVMDKDCWISDEGKSIKSLRNIASYLKSKNEDLDIKSEAPEINYDDFIKTETGKKEFWRIRSACQNSDYELSMTIIELMNFKYKLKIDKSTGEVLAQTEEGN